MERRVARSASSVRAAGSESPAEDRVVGKRVAVHLAGRGGGDVPGGCLQVGGVESRVSLVDVERARECLPRLYGAVAQPGQPGNHHVDLQLGSLGQDVITVKGTFSALGAAGCALHRAGGSLAEETGQRSRGDVHEDVLRPDRILRVALADRDIAARIDAGDLSLRPDLRT